MHSSLKCCNPSDRPSIRRSVSLLVSVWRCVHLSVGLSSCVCLAVRPSIRRSLFLFLPGGASIHPSVSLLVSVWRCVHPSVGLSSCVCLSVCLVSLHPLELRRIARCSHCETGSANRWTDRVLLYLHALDVATAAL